MPSFLPPRAKELHPSLLVKSPKPKPFWRRSISFKSQSRKKSDTSIDSSVPDLSPPAPIFRPYPPPEDGEIVDDTNNAGPGPQELPRYREGYNTPTVRVTTEEVGLWSNEPYITDDENAPRASYDEPVIEDTFGERVKDRLQDFVEQHEYLAKLMERREERKESKRLSY